MPYDKSPQIRLSIDKRGVFAEGLEFGDTGAYEKIVGRVSFAVDPDSPAYSSVVDIQYAPRNPEGLVEFSTDFFILKPSTCPAETTVSSTTSITAAPSFSSTS